MNATDGKEASYNTLKQRTLLMSMASCCLKSVNLELALMSFACGNL